MSQFCKECGAIIRRADATFCSGCGKTLQSGIPATPNISVGAQLQIQEAGQLTRTFTFGKTLITIGREPASEVVLTNDRASRRHLQIEKTGATYWITDENSANGTWVNGVRLPGQQRQLLSSGSRIALGDPNGTAILLIFQDNPPPLNGPLLGAPPLNALPFPATPPTVAQPARLGTIRLPDRPDLMSLAAFTIGRDAGQNQLHLDHPNVSRVHAEVVRTGQGHTIRDVGSSNGTFVNSHPLHGLHTLQRGDVIHIGPFKLVYEQGGLGQAMQATGYRIDANGLVREIEIGFWPRKKIQILNQVNLTVKPGEFVALVGGSGAGKSTLMKALSGFFPANQGQVLLNGDNLYANFAAYRSLLGYVPQDDIIHGQLPVRNALTYAARLRLPDATRAEIEQRIDKVLAQVDMHQHEQKLVNRLSGGQRKRVSIAAELLAEPTVFFLDEPTSGLDPGLEQKMMETMRDLAKRGRTIVLVTHATANIQLCHQVAFMAEGHLAYYGPPDQATHFFGSSDFPDIYNKLAAPGAGVQWAQRFDQQRHQPSIQASGPTPVILAKPRQPHVSSLQQFSVLAQRYLELISRDWASLAVLLLIMPIIGFLLLLMVDAKDLVGKSPSTVATEIQKKIDEAKEKQEPTKDDEQFQGAYQGAGPAQKALLMLALAANLLGVFAAAYEIVKEDAIYQRERMVNLKIWPYLLSKIGVLAIFAAIQCALLLVVIGLRLDYPAHGVFWDARLEMFITLFLATLANICLGLLLSAAVTSRNTVIYVILLVLFVQILFAGALFKLEGVKPISYITTTRWTLEALGSTVNMEALQKAGVSCVEFEKQPPLPPGAAAPTAAPPCTDQQTKLPMDFEFNIAYTRASEHLLARWLLLGGFAVVFSVLTYSVQRRKDVV